MAGPNDAAARRSAIERFNDAYDHQPAANKNDGYFKVPNRTYTPPPPPPPPKPQKIVENSYSREQRWGQGFTAGRALKDNPGFRNPISATQGNLPTSGGGQTTGGNLPPQAPITRVGGAAGFASGISQAVLPGLMQQGPNYLNPSNRQGIFNQNEWIDQRDKAQNAAKLPPGFGINQRGKVSPDVLNPQFWNPLNPISPFNERSPFNPWQKRRPGDDFYPDEPDFDKLPLKNMGLNPNAVRAPNATGNAPRNTNLPPWLDPFKDTSKTGESIPENSGKPNAESKRWFPRPTLIGVWSPNNGRYVTIEALSYSVTEVPKHLDSGPPPVLSARNSNFTYLRDGKDGYTIEWTYVKSTNPVEIGTGSIVIEPWTLQNLGPNPAETTPNPGVPENRIPETNQPFFPPLPKYLDDVAQPYPPTILDPNDFRSPQNQPLSPMFPPELAPIPKPLDPLQKPELPIAPGTQPTKPPEEDTVPKVPPLFPFNPLQSPAPPNPIQDPPPFEPGPVNPNQRLNDRGIFPATKATITPTVSGSPLSPDVEIGGDPVRLIPPAPKITKPPPFEDIPPEQKKKEDEKTLPFPLLPPIFPKPTGPTGTIDPQTADDITKSKNPPPPPVGTKPKCQDGCMAGLETGQQSILDKLNGNGLNVGLNAAELGLLTTINNKMGDQLTGGLGGKLTRLSSWLHLDRALNLMTYANTLHNAYFLSSGLTQTLFSMISNVLAVVGIKDAENNPLDIGSVLGKAADAYAKSVLGVTTVDGIKAEWKKYSRIYAAAASLLWSMQSIGQSILGALEVVGSMVAKIGNALRKFGAIGEKAFGWMNDTPNYQNRFFTALEKTEEVVSQIDQVASEALSIKDTVDQIGTQKKELDDALKQTEGSKQGKTSPEAATVKADETTKKTTSQPPTIPTTAEKKSEA